MKYHLTPFFTLLSESVLAGYMRDIGYSEAGAVETARWLQSRLRPAAT
jgi:hypothetical protein